MSKTEKIVDRFLTIPADFTWNELTTLLNFFGYKESPSGKTGGSRRKFLSDDQHIISLHKPHPGNIVKKYVLRQVIESLKERRNINHE